jgi:hypothetical protein
MDYNDAREGITLYLPVYQEGALLFAGDGHAAEGDGEPEMRSKRPWTWSSPSTSSAAKHRRAPRRNR